ncbi:HAMP domain-containing sensor histidine kinase [Salegentibacter sp. F188]|uniref:histidine kinase n=1 Tax=Autumnicola patrickiae TaxID=3075591 RepID=A0ABU3E5E0_9FLAO|nr:HAMP domain-containing sensor histidine kinase [Salegentibacter sp. F188]MDT0691203.1 HAMP domain-containing sensor histidine kinase [Salegentibacter sp. F188]
MRNWNFRTILYFICTVILATLSIQFYWNYKNYIDGEQQLIREVQSSLDSAIDSYFIDLADRNTIGISVSKDGEILKNTEFDSLLSRIDQQDTGKGIDILDRIDPNDISKMNIISGPGLDDQKKALGTDKLDSENTITDLAKRIILSFTVDTLEISILNSYLNDQLSAKNINVDYAYKFKSNNGVVQTYNTDVVEKNVLSTTAKAAYLPKNSHFELMFTNLTTTILRRNLFGIILSTILVASVVACLFFLLRIINRQKQLAELKNDLISNITHEFKTPISTVKVALEGIEFFNKENDPIKTKNYLLVSNNQLNKLQMMVEKLLETATLDGDNLQLKKEEVPLYRMLSDLVEKHHNLALNKEFSFDAEEKKIFIIADAFHLENALNNIFDNAVKYGGNKIEAVVSSEKEVVKIKISDNGNSLTKPQAEKVFDKFYRVPKGNTHDVKGFGIGLYYTKNIIEKHGGSVELDLNNQTTFIITLPRNG